MSNLPFQPDPSPRTLAVVWESEGLVAIDKPAGLLSQGGPGAAGANVVDLARARFGAPSVGVLHRLDRNVSGLVLVSLAHDVAEAMSAAFAKGEVERRYEAIVRTAGTRSETDDGQPRIIDAPLSKDERTNLVRVVPAGTAGAKEARTRICVRERLQAPMGRLAVLDCWPLTGRSHQIRAHLAYAGMPIVGDPKYGAAARGVHRPLLHASGLVFVHPRTKERVELTSQPPWELAEVRGLMKSGPAPQRNA